MQKYHDVVILSNAKNLGKYVAQSLREILPPLHSVRMTREVGVNSLYYYL